MIKKFKKSKLLTTVLLTSSLLTTSTFTIFAFETDILETDTLKTDILETDVSKTNTFETVTGDYSENQFFIESGLSNEQINLLKNDLESFENDNHNRRKIGSKLQKPEIEFEKPYNKSDFDKMKEKIINEHKKDFNNVVDMGFNFTFFPDMERKIKFDVQINDEMIDKLEAGYYDEEMNYYRCALVEHKTEKDTLVAVPINESFYVYDKLYTFVLKDKVGENLLNKIYIKYVIYEEDTKKRPKESENYIKENGFIYDKMTKFIVGYENDGSYIEEFIIPSTIAGREVIGIGKEALGGYVFGTDKFIPLKYKKLIIQEGIRYIGDGAFFDSRGVDDGSFLKQENNRIIREVQLPESIEYIGKSAFLNTNISKVNLPNNIKVIDRAAFLRNRLTNVTIPENVRIIGGSAFANNELNYLKINAKNILVLKGAFTNNNLQEVIMVKRINFMDRVFDKNVKVIIENK